MPRQGGLYLARTLTKPPEWIDPNQPAVLLGVDGISDFNGLHSRKHDDEVMFYAFDILVSDSDIPSRVPSEIRFVKNWSALSNVATADVRRP